jgi:predicted Zn-dependent protease with MMP-like domain
MDLDLFTDLVSRALEGLPEEFLERLENIQVDVEEWPTREELLDVGLDPTDRYSLLGLYHGVPLTGRSSQYVAFPDRITVYMRPVLAAAGADEAAIAEQVRHTVVHEIAHYYGIDDDRLEELGAY